MSCPRPIKPDKAPCPDKRNKDELPSATSLSELINLYKQKHKNNLEKYLLRFDTITDCVCGGVGNTDAPHPAPFIREGSHQYCMPVATINEVVPRLNEVKSKSFADFDELFAYVDSLSRGVDNYGDLAKYDFSLRYGFKRGLRPEKYVYTHRGAGIGASALVKAGLLNDVKHKIDINDFPSLLRQLGAMHVENFLCIYKIELKQLTK